MNLKLCHGYFGLCCHHRTSTGSLCSGKGLRVVSSAMNKCTYLSISAHDEVNFSLQHIKCKVMFLTESYIEMNVFTILKG